MRLKWLPNVGGVWSAVGDHGTWIIVNTNIAGKPNWWLCVHPWDSNDFEERGNFPNREAAQTHAQDREDGRDPAQPHCLTTYDPVTQSSWSG